MKRLHALDELGKDAHGEPILHAPTLCLDRDVYVPTCDECGHPAGIPHHQYVAPEIAKKGGKPRYPGFLVYWECRGVFCCPSARCESQHLRRHAEVAEKAKAAA